MTNLQNCYNWENINTCFFFFFFCQNICWVLKVMWMGEVCVVELLKVGRNEGLVQSCVFQVGGPFKPPLLLHASHVFGCEHLTSVGVLWLCLSLFNLMREPLLLGQENVNHFLHAIWTTIFLRVYNRMVYSCTSILFFLHLRSLKNTKILF